MSEENIDENIVAGDENENDALDENTTVGAHENVMSQVRRRISSSQFRLEDDETAEGEQQHQNSSFSPSSAAAVKNTSMTQVQQQQQFLSDSSSGGLGGDSSGGGGGGGGSMTRKRRPSLPVTLSQMAQSSGLPAHAPLVSPARQHVDPSSVSATSATTTATTTSAAAAGGGGGGGEQKKEGEKAKVEKKEQQQQQKTQQQEGEEKKQQQQNVEGANQEEEEDDEEDLVLTQQQEQERWRLRRKHVFIFSDAGKPIFTRWGDESDFSELFGILQVLMEMSISNGLGALKHVCLGTHDVHFFSDEHLRYVMVTATNEPPDTCQHQLRMINHCLLSGFPTVNKILEKNSSYDVRAQLLHPSVFRSLVKSMNHEIPMIFQGIDCGFFDSNLRQQMNDTLRKDGFAGYDSSPDETGGGHLMSLVVCRGKILCWGQIPNFQLSTDDILLLIHFSERCCGSMSSLDNTWAPLCLPDYDKEGSFWVHVMQLSNQDDPTTITSATTLDSNKVATSSSGGGGAGGGTNNNNNQSPRSQQQQQQQAAHAIGNNSAVPLLIQLATHTEAISALKSSAQKAKAALMPMIDRITRSAAKVMALPPEWQQLGVMHVLFNRWGVLAYTAAPLHAQEKKHRKNFLRTLLQVRAEALALSKTQRPFLMRSTPYETICFSRKVVRLKSASMGRASAELFVTFLPGTEASAISAAVNRIWDTMLNKDAWLQFVAGRQVWDLK